MNNVVNFDSQMQKAWKIMINEEIKNLRRMLDRKADVSSIEYSSSKASPLLLSNHSSPVTQSSSDLNLSQFDSIIPEINEITHGLDLYSNEENFKKIYSAFNRISKRKLDTTVLSQYASISFVDDLYQKTAIQISAQLNETCILFYQQAVNRVDALRLQLKKFQELVDSRLSDINEACFHLERMVHKLSVSKRKVDGKGKINSSHVKTIYSLAKIKKARTSIYDTNILCELGLKPQLSQIDITELAENSINQMIDNE